MALPVVIINGLGAPHAAAATYAMALRVRGLRAFAVSPSFFGFGDIRSAARKVGSFVEKILAATGAPRVQLVGMSLGGLVGLYYVKCAGGSARVERFVSVGGPLNGSRLACVVRLLPGAPRVFDQLCMFGDFAEELRAAPHAAGVQMFSVGTRGDVVTPRSLWHSDGFEPVETPHGIFPVGHWCLFLLPGNHRVVAELLDG